MIHVPAAVGRNTSTAAGGDGTVKSGGNVPIDGVDPVTPMRRILPAALLCITCVGLASPAVLHAGPKIGVLLKGRSPFWASMEKGALDAGAKLGAEVIVKSPASEADVSVQIQLLNAMATQGF